MSGDIGFDFLVDVGADAVSSIVSDVGSEFISAAGIEELGLSTVASFDVDYADIAGFGGYSQVGSFAGDAAYNDFFNSGGFLDNPAAVADATYNDFFQQGGFISGADIAQTPGFGFPDVLEEPVGRTFGQQIQSIATQVQTDFTGFIKGAQETQKFLNQVAPLVNLATSALGIPNPLAQISGVLNTATAVAGSAAGIANAAAVVSRVATNAPGTVPVTAAGTTTRALPSVGQIVTSAGVPADAPFRELSLEETQALIARNLDPRLVSSFVDSGVPDQETYDQALAAATDLAIQERRLVTEREELKIRQGENSLKIKDLQEDLSDPLINETDREIFARRLIILQAENGELEQAEFDIQQRVIETRQQLAQADAVIAATDARSVSAPQPVTGDSRSLSVAGQLPPGVVARPSLNVRPGDYPASITQQTYNNALRTQAELSPEVERLQQERDALINRLGSNDQAIANLQSQLSNPNLTAEEQDEIARELINLQAENGKLEAEEARVNQDLTEQGQQLAEANATITIVNSSAVIAPAVVPAAPGVQYDAVYNPTTNTYSIYDRVTGESFSAGLSQQQAQQQLAQLGVSAAAIALKTTPATVQSIFDGLGLSDEEILARRNPNNLSDEEVIARQNAITAGLRDAARNQQAIRELRNNKAQSSDWRVRLRLAPNSTYLYNDTSSGPNGILWPLKQTDGVIFPYTPAIDTAYKANYDTYDLVHSNYRGYFYKNSYVDIINVRATFTAQDTNEANYLLAVIHFFRSCTKMFYGQDQQRGSPPPLVYLSGYGDFQFNEHPCLVSQFNYQLPPDVDYIRAGNWLKNNTNLQLARLRNPIANNPLSYSVNRLLNSKLLPGALDKRPATINNLNDGSPTYVPTKMEISIALLPVQSRSNVSQNFSVQGFANGNLLKGGYW